MTLQIPHVEVRAQGIELPLQVQQAQRKEERAQWVSLLDPPRGCDDVVVVVKEGALPFIAPPRHTSIHVGEDNTDLVQEDTTLGEVERIGEIQLQESLPDFP